MRLRSKLLKMLIVSGLLAFFLVSIFGLSYSGMTTTMDEHGNMATSGCSMPGMTALCNMDPIEHISSWQAMFMSTPAQNFILELLLLIASFIALYIWTKRDHSPPLQLEKSFVFESRRHYFVPKSPFLDLFSNGILNPKLF